MHGIVHENTCYLAIHVSNETLGELGVGAVGRYLAHFLS
jgi:hypothetical protein